MIMEAESTAGMKQGQTTENVDAATQDRSDASNVSKMQQLITDVQVACDRIKASEDDERSGFEVWREHLATMRVHTADMVQAYLREYVKL